MKEVLSFNLKAPFAFFCDKSGLEFNSSYPSLTPTFIKGMLGSILGLEGFKDFNKNNCVQYLEDLKHLNIGIELNNYKIVQSPIKFADATLLNITNVKNRPTLIGYSCLNNIDYTVYIILDTNKEIDLQLKDFLIEGKSVYPPYLGKNEFSCSFSDIKVFDFIECKEENIFIDSLYPKNYAKYTDMSESVYKRRTKKDNFKEVFSSNLFFTIPVSSDSLTGQYNKYEKVTFFGPATNIDPNDLIISIKEKNIYMF